jgi:DoxX-like family
MKAIDQLPHPKRRSHMSVATTAENQIGMAGAARRNQELMNDGRTLSRTHARKNAVWAGRVVSGLPVLFLLFDGVIKLANAVPVVEAQSQLGIPQSLTLSIGILELACVLIYAIPQSSFLGAILLTGYLGGATAIQVRVANPLFTHVLFPAYVGVFLWAGLYIRDERLRRLLAFRKVVREVDTPREPVLRVRSTSKRLNAALWIVQGLLAALFLFAGSTKLILPIHVLTSMGSPNQIVLPGWFLRFIGVAEVLGAIGLILPRLLRIRPRLTPLAASGLVIIMTGATSLTLAADGFAPALVPMVAGFLAGFVAYRRWIERLN